MFTWASSELNPEQAAAVRQEGSLFLVACPGSGKTRTLTYKIAYELSRITSNREFVVAITYTNRAADEIKERIQDLGVNTAQLWIGTIHAFCLEWLLKPYGIYQAELAYGFRVVDLHEREKLLERLCAPYSNPRITHWDCEYHFTRDYRVLGCPDARKHRGLNEILDAYHGELRANRLIDFELILKHAHSLISNQPSISDTLSKLFRFILVDEYQDTKEIQYEIIASILRTGKGGTKLFMVGDPNQAIFSSLGGYAIELDQLRFKAQIPIEHFALSQNYRSSARIVQYFGNFNVHQTAIEAAGPDEDYPSLISYDPAINHDGLPEEIARLIRFNVEVKGFSPHEICVLAPQWTYLAAMTRRLAAQLPGYDFNGPGMVPFARDTENIWYRVSRLVLTEPAPGQYIRRLRWANEIIEGLRVAGVTLPELSGKALLRICNSVVIEEPDGLVYLQKFFAELFARLELSLDDYCDLAMQHTAFFDSSTARLARLSADGVEGAGELVFFRKFFKGRTGITMSTIHGVKGGEFDVVIAYALLDGMVPHFNDHQIGSAEKLLYVVGSRARKNLHLFSESGRTRWSSFYTPTQCLEQCQFDYDPV